MNLVASLQDRLRNEGRRRGIQYASLLEQFALSRFFARLAQSDYADRLILKGAQLFRFLQEDGHRPTRDADFLSFSDHDPEALKEIFTEICRVTPEKEDALSWEYIRAAAIRDENSYDGIGSIEVKAFYDILKALAIKYSFQYPEEKLVTLAQAVKAIVDDKTKYTDWNHRDDIKA